MPTGIIWGHAILLLVANGLLAQITGGGFRPPNGVPGFQPVATSPANIAPALTAPPVGAPAAAPVNTTPPAAGASPFNSTQFGSQPAPGVAPLATTPVANTQPTAPATPAAGAAIGASLGAGPTSPLQVTPVANTTATATAAVVARDPGELSNAAGQVLREYSISDYTSKVTTTNKPEQAIIDWILRETGNDVWFSEPLGFLTANREKVTVYHTPEMQKIVANVIDRFVATQAESQVLGLRVVTIGSPDWRATAHPLLRPIAVQTPGIEAWLVSKENAAILAAELARRSDYQEHSAPTLVLHNGQPQTIAKIRPRSFVKNVHLREGTLPGYELEMGKVEEGYSLQISPLFAADGSTIDAVIKCHVDQIERLMPVQIGVPTYGTAQRQQIQIQVPQMSSYRLHERFRWPTDHVLVISAGVGPTPGPDKPNPLGIKIPFMNSAPRADALLFVEARGKASQNLVGQPIPSASAPNYGGRY
ncbi:hypothetical protein [Lignipirellula cremea]|uniref:Bacterial type II and III secretion system protein n=1 Tax=Lignipirellula cremea TaxID=2528010 RepID=A0A518DWR6_9BACT|nr:hypothetical protein [Lignipirellula cremea]QDU96277.1 hypothetical protein Pla8534_40970 [Lignipirellula cremea]